MKKLITVLFALILVSFCGCDKTAVPEESGRTVYAATGEFTRPGYAYTGLDAIFYEGRLYFFMPGRYEYGSGDMVKIGEVSATRDGLPEKPFENARDLDAGTKLYMYPDDIRYIFARVPGKSPGEAGTAYCYFGEYSGGESLMYEGKIYSYRFSNAVLPRDAVPAGKISSVSLSEPQKDYETARSLDIGTELFVSPGRPGSVYAKTGARRLDDGRGYIEYREETE